MPINPKTTLGIAARISTSDLRMPLMDFGATSAMNIAVPTPNGTLIKMAAKVTYKEPRKSGIMPNWEGSETGSQFLPKRNEPTEWLRKSDSESLSKNKKIRKTNAITRKPLSLMHSSMINSLGLFRTYNS